MARKITDDFGIFEDSLPDGYGQYLLHKIQREGIDDSSLSALDRLAIVGEGGMGTLTSTAPANLASLIS